MCQDLPGWLLSGALQRIPAHETLVVTHWSVVRDVCRRIRSLLQARPPPGPACHCDVIPQLDPAGGWAGKELSAPSVAPFSKSLCRDASPAQDQIIQSLFLAFCLFFFPPFSLASPAAPHHLQALGDVCASSRGRAGQLSGWCANRDDYLALLHCSAVMMAIYQAVPWWTGPDLDTRVSVLPNSSTHVVPAPAFLEGRRIWRELPDTPPSMHNNLWLGGRKRDNKGKKKQEKKKKKTNFLPMIPW